MNWIEYARKMAEAGRAKIAEDLKRLEALRSQQESRQRERRVPAATR